jgi:hypothetical protein
VGSVDAMRAKAVMEIGMSPSVQHASEARLRVLAYAF